MSVAVALAAVLLAIHGLIGALDLGVGLLLPLATRGRDRDAIVAGGGRPWSAGAIWTLVLFAFAVAGLPGGAAPLRALWPALALMLLALALRGLVAALRPHVLRQDLADLAYGLASVLAVACQGLVLGWFVGGLGAGLPARHAGPLGALSIWGLLCAAASVGLYALLGSGWLILSGRGAVRTFGREVGRAAALLCAGSIALCAAWAAWPTGVLGRALGDGSGVASASLACASLAPLVPFVLSLWGRRPAVPLACATLSALCGAMAVAVLVRPSDEHEFAAYMAFILMIGLPLPVFDLLRRRAAAARGVAAGPADQTTPSHAGRRAGALTNSLHLS